MQLKPVDANIVLKEKVYEALKSAIMSMDIYADNADTKLDERRLAEELGVSRTPIREALTLLEKEGLVRMIPRRGAFVVRKTKQEILESICVWSALECLAARLASARASDEEIARLRQEFASPEDPKQAAAFIDEYSDDNIRFHRSIIRLAKCKPLSEIAEGLFVHMHALRAHSTKGHAAASDSSVNHLHIVEALEKRDTELAEKLVREHTEHLSEEVEKHVNWVE
jgi:DNA-binding GntR family transcriptional regulator